MNNLREDLKRLAKMRRELFNAFDLLEIKENNLRRLNKLNKREELKIFKEGKKIREALLDLDNQVNNLDYLGLGDEAIAQLSLDILKELDLEE